MDLDSIAKIVKQDLIEALRYGEWVNSGDLIDSISVKIDPSTFEIQIEALDYLEYLDNGNFINEFLEDEINKITSLIGDMIAESIRAEIFNELDSTIKTK